MYSRSDQIAECAQQCPPVATGGTLGALQILRVADAVRVECLDELAQEVLDVAKPLVRRASLQLVTHRAAQGANATSQRSRNAA